MKNNPLRQLETFGQSFWLDYIRRDLMVSEVKNQSTPLKRLIDNDGLRGMTSNPSIFEKAIVSSHDYDEDIQRMASEEKESIEIYEALSQIDVQRAADEFRTLYDKTDGKDGYVSLEVNPHLAHDAKGTIEEARRLWTALNRPNVFIKIPATSEGLSAIKKIISEGINVNVTLLFGLHRYQHVVETYLDGIEDRLALGKDVSHVCSVASFFVSRIDALVDPLLEKIIAEENSKADLARQMLGQVAISSAKVAYQIYKEMFASERFKKLSEKGACTQRLLWASTGTKNPKFNDIKYIEALIGADTVNTIPVKTLDAYRDHGKPKARLDNDIEQAKLVLERLPELGINIDSLTQKLVNDGLDKFCQPFDNLLASINKIITKQ